MDQSFQELWDKQKAHIIAQFERDVAEKQVALDLRAASWQARIDKLEAAVEKTQRNLEAAEQQLRLDERHWKGHLDEAHANNRRLEEQVCKLRGLLQAALSGKTEANQ